MGKDVDPRVLCSPDTHAVMSRTSLLSSVSIPAPLCVGRFRSPWAASLPQPGPFSGTHPGFCYEMGLRMPFAGHRHLFSVPPLGLLSSPF